MRHSNTNKGKAYKGGSSSPRTTLGGKTGADMSAMSQIKSSMKKGK